MARMPPKLSPHCPQTVAAVRLSAALGLFCTHMHKKIICLENMTSVLLWLESARSRTRRRFCQLARGGRSSTDLFAKWAREIRLLNQFALDCGAPPVQVVLRWVTAGSFHSRPCLSWTQEQLPVWQWSWVKRRRQMWMRAAFIPLLFAWFRKSACAKLFFAVIRVCCHCVKRL